MTYSPNKKLTVKRGSYNASTVKTIDDMNKISNRVTMNEEAVQEGPPSIPSYRYTMAIHEMMLLRSMDVLNNDEIKRLISQLKSPDHENWTVAEECIKQKLT